MAMLVCAWEPHDMCLSWIIDNIMNQLKLTPCSTVITWQLLYSYLLTHIFTKSTHLWLSKCGALIHSLSTDSGGQAVELVYKLYQ